MSDGKGESRRVTLGPDAVAVVAATLSTRAAGEGC